MQHIDHLITMAPAIFLLIKIVGQALSHLQRLQPKSLQLSQISKTISTELLSSGSLLPFFLPTSPKWGSATMQDMLTNQKMPPRITASYSAQSEFAIPTWNNQLMGNCCPHNWMTPDMQLLVQVTSNLDFHLFQTWLPWQIPTHCPSGCHVILSQSKASSTLYLRSTDTDMGHGHDMTRTCRHGISQKSRTRTRQGHVNI